MTTTTMTHVWRIERQKGTNDWSEAESSTAGPLADERLEWYRQQYPEDNFRQVHETTLTHVERTVIG